MLQLFIEKLDKHIDQDEAIKVLKQLISDGNFQAIKMYFEYTSKLRSNFRIIIVELYFFAF